MLSKITLSQLPLIGASWADILEGTRFATQPLQAITFLDMATDTERGADGQTPWQRLSALPLSKLAFVTSLWRNVPVGTLLLGNTPLDQIPTPVGADGTQYGNWRDAIVASGGRLDGVDTSTNTAFGVAIAGEFGTPNIGSIAVSGTGTSGSIGTAGSIGTIGSIAISALDLHFTPLGTIPLSSVNATGIITCTGSFLCPAGSTLNDAQAAGAILPSLTLAGLYAHLTSPANQTPVTIGQLIQAMLDRADYPWEQLSIQGLQDVAGTGQNAHYHVNFDLSCSAAQNIEGPPTFSVHVNLPSGFFPVAGSSRFTFAGGDPVNVGNPTGDARRADLEQRAAGAVQRRGSSGVGPCAARLPVVRRPDARVEDV